MRHLIKFFFCFIFLLHAGCADSKKNRLKIAATAVPHARMLEFIQPDLSERGVDLDILVIDDYNVPNRALAEKEIAANFFQHIPFLEAQVQAFHYPLVNFANIHIEPMGVYSKKYHSLGELPEKAVISIPSDPTNEARALLLLDQKGLIRLENVNDLNATPMNIVDNPKHFQFLEVDAALLSRTLNDVDASIINANFALQAGMSPLQDALALEGKDSPYVNILVIREEDQNKPELLLLKEWMTSEKMRTFILNTYKGAVIPVF